MKTPKEKLPMTVTRIEHEVMKFWVSSETTPGQRYRVDLEANPIRIKDKVVHNGWCACPDFLKKQKVAEGGRLCRCKHLRAAREEIADYAIADQINRLHNRDRAFQAIERGR